jgi:Ca2+-binding RTX toxin-like protein
MATKIFNPTEISYTGTSGNDFIVGNNLGNTIDGGEGNNIIAGGGGDDLIFTGDGNDVISGGDGNDTIIAGNGSNIVSGGNGSDFIITGSGNDIISGGAGDDTIYGGDGDDVLSGGDGADFISGEGSTKGNETVVGNLFIVSSDDILIGGSGNDTFSIGSELEGSVIIQGGVSGLDNAGESARYVSVSLGDDDDEDAEPMALDTTTGEYVEIEDQEMSEEIETDVRLNIVTRPGSSAISTFATTIAGYNAVDTLEFTQSGEFESIAFTGIERIELASGVNITLEAE